MCAIQGYTGPHVWVMDHVDASDKVDRNEIWTMVMGTPIVIFLLKSNEGFGQSVCRESLRLTLLMHQHMKQGSPSFARHQQRINVHSGSRRLRLPARFQRRS